MRETDRTELDELLKQEAEKSVSKGNSVGSTWGGPRQPPPTGGQGGTGVHVGK
jgi:hypothetical protein